MKSTPTKRNVHGQRDNFVFGTQRNLYSADSHWRFALGVTQNLVAALGVALILAFLAIATFLAKFRVGGLDPMRSTHASVFTSQWNIGFSLLFFFFFFLKIKVFYFTCPLDSLLPECTSPTTKDTCPRCLKRPYLTQLLFYEQLEYLICMALLPELGLKYLVF